MTSRSRMRRSCAALALAAGALSATAAMAQNADKSASKMDEVTITVLRVKALDKIDTVGANKQADFFARATIGGTVVKSEVSKNKDDIKPIWKLKAAVPRGTATIKLEILDKDILTPADAVDINRVDKKRDLDFSVDTKSCKIGGFSSGFRCGSVIARAGAEKRRAAVTFRVDVSPAK